MHRQTIEAYDADAQHWLTTRYDPSQPALPAAARLRELVGEGLILDLGCGPGQLLAGLAEPSIGVDASAGMLALARELGRLQLLRADIESLPVKKGGAAGAFANFSLQHLPRAGFRRAVREVRRALRPGGHLELTMHSADARFSDQGDGIRVGDDMPVGRWFSYWEIGDVVQVLEHEGLVMVDVEDLGFANRFLASRP